MNGPCLVYRSMYLGTYLHMFVLVPKAKNRFTFFIAEHYQRPQFSKRKQFFEFYILIMKVRTTEKLNHLRQLMRDATLSAYIIPSCDAHNSEYLAECDKRR